MKFAIQRVLTEPLAHFGLLAAVVFGWDGWLRTEHVESTRIEVSADFIRWLAESRARRTGRTVSRTELEADLDDHIEEELLIREARRLALADGDPIVRRRIAQKMKFLFEDGANAPLTDDDLQQYLQSHADRYRVPAAIKISQVFVGTGQPARHQVAAVQRALDADPDALVGRPLPISRSLGYVETAELARLFSPAAVSRLANAPMNRWVGPVASRFGHHFVRVEDQRPPRLPPLSEIRSRVKADLLASRRRDAFASELARLRARYEIDVDWPSTDDPALTVLHEEGR